MVPTGVPLELPVLSHPSAKAHHTRMDVLESNALAKIAERKAWMEDHVRGDQPWPKAEMAFGWILFAPTFPCLWTLDRGNGGVQKARDGPKWTCGLPEVEKAGRSEASRCIVHSWGSRGEVSFENAVQALAPSCEIHIFDHSKPIRPVPRGGSARAVQYHCTWLGPQWKVDKHDLPGDPLMMTLETAMKSLGQTYVDVLKVDVEEWEWSSFAETDWHKINVGQIQVEIHPARGKKLGDLASLFDVLEEAGFRGMSVEPVNWHERVEQATEYVFVHRSWTPAGFAVHGLGDNSTGHPHSHNGAGGHTHQGAHGTVQRRHPQPQVLGSGSSSHVPE